MWLTVQTLFGSEPGAAAALAARVANDQMTVLAQILQRELTPEPVQRMIRMRRRNEAQPDQEIAGESARYLRTDGEIDAPLEKCLFGTAQHRFVQLDARFRTDLGEAGEAVEQQPGRKDDLDRQPQFRFPACREAARRVLERAGFLEERFGATVQNFPGRGQAGLAADYLEDLHAQERFHFLDRVGDGGLALVKRGGGLRISAGVDHRQQRAPLFERDPRVCSHIYLLN